LMYEEKVGRGGGGVARRRAPGGDVRDKGGSRPPELPIKGKEKKGGRLPKVYPQDHPFGKLGGRGNTLVGEGGRRKKGKGGINPGKIPEEERRAARPLRWAGIHATKKEGLPLFFWKVKKKKRVKIQLGRN